MARQKFKVTLASGAQRIIELDPKATAGASFDTDLYMKDGALATPKLVATWLGLSATGAVTRSTTQHSQLQGLDGNDHPQYALVAALAAVAFSNDYNDLSNLPALAAVALSGAYADLSGAPSLAAVATSGAYADLSGKPTLGTAAALDSDTDVTLAADSDARIATQKATKAYVDASITPGAGSALQYLGEVTVTGSAATSLQFSGLDLNADGLYLFEFITSNATGSNTGYTLTYNADTTAANYDTEAVGASGSTLGSAGANDASITSGIGAANPVSIIGFMFPNFDGKPCSIMFVSIVKTTTRLLRFLSNQWRTATNATSFTITTTTSNALAIGSKIRVWKVSI